MAQRDVEAQRARVTHAITTSEVDAMTADEMTADARTADAMSADAMTADAMTATAHEITPSERFSLHFANERTFLAWIRTATALMAFGYAIARFAVYLDDLGGGERRLSLTYVGGVAMTLAGLVALGLSATRYAANSRGIEHGGSARTHEGYLYMFASLVGITGIVLVLLLFAGH